MRLRFRLHDREELNLDGADGRHVQRLVSGRPGAALQGASAFLHAGEGFDSRGLLLAQIRLSDWSLAGTVQPCTAQVPSNRPARDLAAEAHFSSKVA